mmetsp:Transcript_25842/g.65365  ORF Transcript_25842/g.65365 Transcript_25842/m.65365 type:complete len:161 (+) Transcript_25842:1943-2425(+)
MKRVFVMVPPSCRENWVDMGEFLAFLYCRKFEVVRMHTVSLTSFDVEFLFEKYRLDFWFAELVQQTTLSPKKAVWMILEHTSGNAPHAWEKQYEQHRKELPLSFQKSISIGRAEEDHRPIAVQKKGSDLLTILSSLWVAKSGPDKDQIISYFMCNFPKYT